MSEVKFTCTEAKLVHYDPQTGQSIVLMNGDTITVSSEVAEQYTSLGWGTADGMETGERKPGAAKLDLASVTAPVTGLV